MSRPAPGPARRASDRRQPSASHRNALDARCRTVTELGQPLDDDGLAAGDAVGGAEVVEGLPVGEAVGEDEDLVGAELRPSGGVEGVDRLAGGVSVRSVCNRRRARRARRSGRDDRRSAPRFRRPPCRHPARIIGSHRMSPAQKRDGGRLVGLGDVEELVVGRPAVIVGIGAPAASRATVSRLLNFRICSGATPNVAASDARCAASPVPAGSGTTGPSIATHVSSRSCSVALGRGRWRRRRRRRRRGRRRRRSSARRAAAGRPGPSSARRPAGHRRRRRASSWSPAVDASTTTSCSLLASDICSPLTARTVSSAS